MPRDPGFWNAEPLSLPLRHAPPGNTQQQTRAHQYQRRGLRRAARRCERISHAVRSEIVLISAGGARRGRPVADAKIQKGRACRCVKHLRGSCAILGQPVTDKEDLIEQGERLLKAVALPVVKSSASGAAPDGPAAATKTPIRAPEPASVIPDMLPAPVLVPGMTENVPIPSGSL